MGVGPQCQRSSAMTMFVIAQTVFLIDMNLFAFRFIQGAPLSRRAWGVFESGFVLLWLSVAVCFHQ